MGRIIGIDLGTTNSCVAVLEQGEAKIIPAEDGSRTVPSMVAVTAQKEILVGRLAKRQAVINPKGTVFAVKRLIGRKLKEPAVKLFKAAVPYEITSAPNGDPRIILKEKEFTPEEISAFILEKLKENAEKYLGEEVDEAVITVPAYFNERQRQATKDAGKIAGLNVRRIINEPTAAALAYGYQKEKTGIIAVFDLGGGTFDISILQLEKGVFEVRSTNGNTALGGEDFDTLLTNQLAEAFKKETGIDLHKMPQSLQRLKEAVEQVKCELSEVMESTVNLPFLAVKDKEPQHLYATIHRSVLEELSKDLIAKLESPCIQAMKEVGLTPEDIGAVILIGGMTRMPAVQLKAEKIFKRKASRDINPEEAVALGAAIQSGIILGEIQEALLLDITPYSLGVAVKGGKVSKIIEKNTTIPTEARKIFTTTQDNQDFVTIRVYQGESEFAKENKLLAKFDLENIPSAPAGTPKIEVCFKIDVNGILHASAKDLKTNKETSIQITPDSGLSPLEVEMLQRKHNQEREITIH
jgi:molecular chaperone DnaK